MGIIDPCALTPEIDKKVRWLAYLQKKTKRAVVREALQRAFAGVEVPEMPKVPWDNGGESDDS